MKAVTAAQLSMAAGGVYSVTLDEAIEAMRLTAADMSVKYKETSLSVSPCSHVFLPRVAQICLIGSCGMYTSHQLEFGVEFLYRQVSGSLSQSRPGGCSFVSSSRSINSINSQIAEVLLALHTGFLFRNKYCRSIPWTMTEITEGPDRVAIRCRIYLSLHVN